MESQSWPFAEVCKELHREFFTTFPDAEFCDLVNQALTMLLAKQADFPGDVGAWAGGIVYAVGNNRYGVPNASNAELEAAFSTKMPAIRTKAAKIKQLLGDDAPLYIPNLAEIAKLAFQEFTLRDEANAMVAFAFRNGPIEDIHADGRISDDEMKRLMINTCENLTKLLTMKHATPEEYDSFIRDYGKKFCWRWER